MSGYNAISIGIPSEGDVVVSSGKFLVLSHGKLLTINADTHHVESTGGVDVDPTKEYKIIGNIHPNQSLTEQNNYWKAVATYWRRKQMSHHHLSSNLIKGMVTNIKAQLQRWNQGNISAGMKKTYRIGNYGVLEVRELSKKLAIRRWKINKRTWIIVLNDVQVALLFGDAKYQKGMEVYSFDGTRLIWSHSDDTELAKHKDFHVMRLEMHVKSTHTQTKRVIGGIAQQRSKAKAKRFKKSQEKKRQKEEAQLSKHPSVVLFYRSLYKENKSEFARSWLVSHGHENKIF